MGGFRLGPRGISGGIRQLVIANVVFFVLSLTTGMTFWANWFGLRPDLVFTHFFIWQPLTYMFLHGGLWHLAMNMLMLWMFGSELERLWGTKEFLRYYFITGIGAGIFSLVPYLFSLLTGPTVMIPIIGASGAVFGVLLAYAMTYPERMVLVFGIVPMKVKYLMLLMGLVTLTSLGSNSGIAHITHLGGLVVGWLYLKRSGRYHDLTMNLPFREWWQKFLGLFKIRVIPGEKKKSAREQGWRSVNDQRNQRSEMDQLLDKITRVGYENLSNAEKKRLLELSGKLSGNDRPD